MSINNHKKMLKEILTELIFAYHERNFVGGWELRDDEILEISRAISFHKKGFIHLMHYHFEMDAERYELISSWYSCLKGEAYFGLEADALSYLNNNGYDYDSFDEAEQDEEGNYTGSVLSFHKKEWDDTETTVDYTAMLKKSISDMLQHHNGYGYALPENWLPTDKEMESIINSYNDKTNEESFTDFADNSAVVDEIVLRSCKVAAQ